MTQVSGKQDGVSEVGDGSPAVRSSATRSNLRRAVTLATVVCGAAAGVMTFVSKANTSGPAPKVVPSLGAAPGRWFVAPGADGDCSAASPCGSVQSAVSRAAAGQVIELAGGSYPAQVITSPNTWDTSVVVQPAPGASVSIAGLDIGSPRLTFRGLRTAGATFNYGSHHGRFEKMTVTGSTFIISSDDIAIVNSRLGPTSGNDTLKIAPGGAGQHRPTNVVVEGNEIGPALLTAPDQHIDAIQTHGVVNLVIRRNIIREAASQTVTLGQESGPNSDILVENNEIEQCAPARAECGAFYATSGSGTDVRFVHNTIKGAAYPDDAFYVGNIIGAATCTRYMTHNLVRALASQGLGCSLTNVVGTPSYLADGYHLAPGSLGLDIGGPTGPAVDIDGDRRTFPADAGADEVSKAPVVLSPVTRPPPVVEPPHPTWTLGNPFSLALDEVSGALRVLAIQTSC